MDFNKISYKCIFSSQFSQCPLIWMVYNRTYNNKINRLHVRCQPLYNDKCLSFEELLVKDKSVTINHKIIHALAIEMFKVYNKTSQEIMREVFQITDQGHYF